MIAGWETLYKNAYPRGMSRLASLPGVACAFHSVIDGCIRLTPEIILPVLESDPSLKAAALAGCTGDAPLEILSPQDFVRTLFYSLFRGAAAQRMIRSQSTYEWALKTFGPGTLRLGGTSANMARSLVPLGIPVTVYANPLTKELANLFGDFENLSVIARKDGAFARVHPKEAAQEQGVFAIHWIFEYGTDFVIELDGLHIRPHRANRCIPSWNPRNNQFKMDPEFADGFLDLIDSYGFLLFSGFHILSEKYPDGSTCREAIAPLADYLVEIRKRAPGMKIHLELASIASPIVRRAVLDLIVPQVHSIGLNETELPLMLELFGPGIVSEFLGDSPTAAHYARAVAFLMQRTGLQRLHFHNLGYYLCLETQPFHTLQDTRDGLLFAAIMAAARARNGLFSSPQDIHAGLDTPIGDIGLEQLKILSNVLNQPSILEEGIGRIEGLPLAAIPTKLVKNPLFTVGLGDTISTGAILTE